MWESPYIFYYKRTRCTIAPGVTIGEGAKVDMCSFVIKNVRAFSHIRGDPKFVATELR